jgi:hypothetical protein
MVLSFFLNYPQEHTMTNDINISVSPETKEKVKVKLERAKVYVKTNAKPLAIGTAVGAVTVWAVFRGYNLNKDLLILRRKQLKRLAKGAGAANEAGESYGVEYNIRGIRVWLIPALASEADTPYIS